MKYREINTALGQTGAGLTVDQIRENPDLKDILGTFVLEHLCRIYSLVFAFRSAYRRP